MQTGYLLGLPVAAYSLDIGKAHTDFAEGKIQMRLIERQLEDNEIDTFAIVSMAGVASEATKYEEVQQLNQQMSHSPLPPAPDPFLVDAT